MTPSRPTRFAPASLLLITSLLLLGGCVTTPAPVKPTAPITEVSPTKPPSVPAVAPVPMVEAKPATITGSEESSTMFDNLTAYVAAVDGKTIAGGRNAWKTPLALPAGPHTLTVEFTRGVFFARASLQVTARPEAVYQLKFATDAEVFGKNSYCEFWIVDTATGKNVTAPLRMPLIKTARPE